MTAEVYTTLGTRVLMLTDGSSVCVTKDESGGVVVSETHHSDGTRTVRCMKCDAEAVCVQLPSGWDVEIFRVKGQAQKGSAAPKESLETRFTCPEHSDRFRKT